MGELQWWISLNFFFPHQGALTSIIFMSKAKGMASLWAHLAPGLSHWATTSHTFSESRQSLLLISATGSSLVDKRASWADVRGKIPEPAHSHLQLSWPGKCWQNFSLLLSVVPLHTNESVFSICAVLEAVKCQWCALKAGMQWRTLELSQNSGNPHFSPYTTSMKMSSFPITI